MSTGLKRTLGPQQNSVGINVMEVSVQGGGDEKSSPPGTFIPDSEHRH